MSDEAPSRNVADTIDAVTGLVKSVPVYQDAIQPAAREFGKALQTVGQLVNVALAPLRGLVWGYGQFEEYLSTKVADRLQKVPPENIVSPRLYIAGPALEALRYCGNEADLSDLYANLLAASMDKSTADGVHPAFVEIIKQLTPDEAKLVALLSNDRMLPLIDLFRVTSVYPKGIEGQEEVLVSFSHLGRLAGCDFENMTPVYINNLCRLGLAEIPLNAVYPFEGAYDELENDPYVRAQFEEIVNSGIYRPEIEQKLLQVTELGKQFVKTCVLRKS